MALDSAWLLLALLVAIHASSTVATAAPELPFVNVTFSAESRTGPYCTQPKNAVRSWRLTRYVKESYSCLKHPTKAGYWTMLNAYLSDGTNGKHWKHATNRNDPTCLKDWTYYGKDGVWVVEHVQGAITLKGDSGKNPWCALPVAQVKKKTKTEPAGVEGNQWAFCTCSDKAPSQA